MSEVDKYLKDLTEEAKLEFPKLALIPILALTLPGLLLFLGIEKIHSQYAKGYKDRIKKKVFKLYDKLPDNDPNKGKILAYMLGIKE